MTEPPEIKPGELVKGATEKIEVTHGEDGHPLPDLSKVVNSSHRVAYGILATKDIQRLAELVRLRQVGDQMQSAGSRVAEWMAEQIENPDVDVLPYEVRMAYLELTAAIHHWTEIRKESV